jgi:GT2 family glycosyltransferase
MQEVDIAAVIVTYKCAALTVDCLRSVASERSDPNIRIRVYVIDNASGDSASIIRDLVRHSVLWPKNRNLSALRGFRPPVSKLMSCNKHPLFSAITSGSRPTFP